jgi:hypothetical protein
MTLTDMLVGNQQYDLATRELSLAAPPRTLGAPSSAESVSGLRPGRGIPGTIQTTDVMFGPDASLAFTLSAPLAVSR